MKHKIASLSVFVLLLVTMGLYGQESKNHKNIFPGGISIEQGMGHYSVRDEFVTKAKYSGILPYFAVNWSRFHDKSGYRFKLEFRNSSNIKNNNISTDILQFLFHTDYIYPVGKFSLFSRDVYAYLGPSSEFFMYYNHPDIAIEQTYALFSFVTLLSLGINSELIYPVSNRFQLESSLYLNICSICMRMVELLTEDEIERPVNLLNMLSGMRTSLGFGLRYSFLKSVSVKAGYKLQLTRVSKWDTFISASDNITATLTYHF